MTTNKSRRLLHQSNYSLLLAILLLFLVACSYFQDVLSRTLEARPTGSRIIGDLLPRKPLHENEKQSRLYFQIIPRSGKEVYEYRIGIFPHNSTKECPLVSKPGLEGSRVDCLVQRQIRNTFLYMAMSVIWIGVACIIFLVIIGCIRRERARHLTRFHNSVGSRKTSVKATPVLERPLME